MSPNSGILRSLTEILTILFPLEVSVKNILSTTPFSPCLKDIELSLMLAIPDINSFADKNLNGDVLPTKTESLSTAVSGDNTPSSAKLT